jgi:hypothetical protein
MYDFFNDAVSWSRCKASNDSMISDLWIGKNVEGRGRGLIWGINAVFAWRDGGKPPGNFSQDSWPRGRDLKLQVK